MTRYITENLQTVSNEENSNEENSDKENFIEQMKHHIIFFEGAILKMSLLRKLF